MKVKEPSSAIKKDRFFIVILPIFIAIIVFLLINFVCYKIGFQMDLANGIDNFKTMLNVWSTLLGFLITALSILLVLNDGRFINMLKKTGHFKTVLITYIVCSLHLFFSVIVAIICIFFRIWSPTVFSFMCALCVDTLIMVAICLVFLFILVLRINE